METLITLTNGLSAIAFLLVLVLAVLVTKEGKDERAILLEYKLFSFLFGFVFMGLSAIIFYTGWISLDYVMLRVCITTLMSLTILAGFFSWLVICKKY